MARTRLAGCWHFAPRSAHRAAPSRSSSCSAACACAWGFIGSLRSRCAAGSTAPPSAWNTPAVPAAATHCPGPTPTAIRCRCSPRSHATCCPKGAAAPIAALAGFEFSSGEGGYQPTEFITRDLPQDYFGVLIVDEGHEYKNEGSAQGLGMGMGMGMLARKSAGPCCSPAP
jgi:hypothetical protein